MVKSDCTNDSRPGLCDVVMGEVRGRRWREKEKMREKGNEEKKGRDFVMEDEREESTENPGGGNVNPSIFASFHLLQVWLFH